MRWGPRLGTFVDFFEFDDGVTGCGAALFKTVEALSRGAFFFSTSAELKTKGAGGGGAGRKIMDSNTSLPWIFTPRHFWQFLLYIHSLSPGVWQSFVTIRSCNHLMRIISTYVDNTTKSEIL